MYTHTITLKFDATTRDMPELVRDAIASITPVPYLHEVKGATRGTFTIDAEKMPMHFDIVRRAIEPLILNGEIRVFDRKQIIFNSFEAMRDSLESALKKLASMDSLQYDAERFYMWKLTKSV